MGKQLLRVVASSAPPPPFGERRMKPQMNIVFHKIPSKFEAIYCEDTRRWSKSSHILWLEIATDCNSGCRYCHYHMQRKLDWLNSDNLEQIKDYIERMEHREVHLHITPILGDVLLSPYLKDILKWCVRKKAVINLMSYLPYLVNLRELQANLVDYAENCCLCWSLHAYSDKERCKLFKCPHSISSVLPIINKDGGLRNTVYSFSNLNDYGMLGLLDPQNVRITMIPFVDYSTNTIFENKSLIKYPNQRILAPNLDMFVISYPDRRFFIL